MKLPPPPPRFIPAGEIRRAAFAKQTPPFIKHKRLVGRRAAGIRYENKAQARLLAEYSTQYIASPWLIYEDSEGKQRWCQPDGFLLDIPNGIITVVEIKYHHTSDAWWQIWRLYVPVLAAIFPGFTFRGVEVVGWYDPSVEFPSGAMIHTLARPPHPPQTGIHILKV